MELAVSGTAGGASWHPAGSDQAGGGAVRIDQVESLEVPRREVGLSEFDRVLGGGLVSGAAILLGGEPGVGKSTLLLQAAARLAAGGTRILYVTSEESLQQVRLRADRLLGTDASAASENMYLCAETDLARIAEQVHAVDPAVVLLDSIQMIYRADLDAPPGSTTQLRRCCHDLVQMAKLGDRAMVVVGHVTKDGNLAGPKMLEHLVDVVLSIDGDREHGHRVLRAAKNRFGSTQEIGLFEMTSAGMAELETAGAMIDPTKLGVNGEVLVATMAGSRCLPAEIQALTGYRADFSLVRGPDAADGQEVWSTCLVEVNDGYVSGRYDEFPPSDFADMIISRFRSLQRTAVRGDERREEKDSGSGDDLRLPSEGKNLLVAALSNVGEEDEALARAIAASTASQP